MPRRLRAIEARLVPHGWIDVVRQALLFAGAFLLYNAVRLAVAPRPDLYKPFGNAMRIIDLERTLHIFIEPSVQAWALNVHWLIDAADWTYLNGHFFVTLGALVWMYVRRNDSFYFVRNVVMIAMAIALVGYWLYPTAPPRLMPEWGFTDSVSEFVTGGTSWIDYTPARDFTNFYAAVPSMHVCFAAIIGGSMLRLVRRRWAKALWALYPVVVTFVVVATANHFLTDVALGALTAVAAGLVADRLLARARPHVWTFGQAAA
jgi:membrane-associated phospholipid phosphatase